ncbi:MAG: CDP-diacylglycerol--glycerol-3-phosphate 3-phosphatidyltransferase [Candidatus Protistobacter heckmanni]|nr:CDP-diacylglycerol--glycerol-3-phosphate 3-phosphatidyltransferase [Candidatus Protistobacter heckmanni]
MPLNFPIFLTWLRVAAIPLIVGVFYLPDGLLVPQSKNLIAAILFILAALTDWLDGFLARRWNQTSAFGAFLDPVADKLMVTAALLVLLSMSRVNALVALVIIGREITISALREWMAQIGASRSIAVNFLGKLKTTFQMIAIPLLLFDGLLFGRYDTQMPGTVLVWVAAVLTVASMIYYLRLALPSIRASQAASEKARREGKVS